MRKPFLVGLFALIALFTLHGLAWSASPASVVSQGIEEGPTPPPQPTQVPPSECPDPYEPNDNFSQAALVIPGTTIQAYICTQGERDYYKFYVGSGKTITVTLFNIPSVHDYSLRLADPNRTVVDKSNQPGNTDEQIVPRAATPGVWYTIVRGDRGASYTKAYRLRVEVGSSRTHLYLPWVQR